MPHSPQPTAAPSQTASTPTLLPVMFPLRMRAGPLCRPRPCSHCSTTIPRQQCVLSPSLPLTEIIELDSNGEEKGSEFVEVETTSVQPLVCHDTTVPETLHQVPQPHPRLHPQFCLSHRTPHPRHPRERVSRVAAQTPKGRHWPHHRHARNLNQYSRPVVPSQYVHVPFMKRVVSQEVIAPAAADVETLPISLPLSPQQAEAPA